jgi:hypothetical protein
MSQAGPVGGRGRSGAAIAWIGWWAASGGVYLVLLDSVSLHELVTGSVIAIIGASGATLLRAAAGGDATRGGVARALMAPGRAQSGGPHAN